MADGWRDASSKTRIETYQIVSKLLPQERWRDASSKTRIETAKMKENSLESNLVGEMLPAKQGLKQALKSIKKIEQRLLERCFQQNKD